jgi:hypothetical protein
VYLYVELIIANLRLDLAVLKFDEITLGELRHGLVLADLVRV